MDKSAPPVYFVVLFPFLFVGMWCFVSLAISMLGGWRRLAESFPARGEPSGKQFSMQGGKVGQANYSGCLTIYSSPEGLYLSIMFPFRLGHPPLFIPWDAIHNVKTRRFLWVESVTFDVGSPSIARLQLPKKIFEGHSNVWRGA
ncbi:MAG TPA: hypothetical protein VMH87_04460 [Pseudomonadales bacterium]|nr:hypothetical protein [Pseudomonadales bacterium]